MSSEYSPAIITPAPIASVLDPEEGPIDPQLVAWLEEEFTKLRGLLTRTTRDFITIGELLTGVKEGLTYQEFLQFLAVVGLSRATAYRWMAAAQVAMGCSHAENIELTALYTLSAKSTPEEVRHGFLARAEAGYQVTVQEVQTTLKQARIGSSRPAPNLAERLVDGMVAAEDAKAGRDWRGRDVRAERIAREIGRYGEEHRAGVAAAVATWGSACLEAAAAYLEDGGEA